jgi:hypothetical protein
MANQFKIAQILHQIEDVKSTLPTQLGAQAVNFFVRSWDKQGFDDGGVKQWAEVNRRIKGTAEYKYPKTKGLSRRTKPILVQTGQTRRAVSASLRTATFQKVELIVPVPYAEYLNEGTDKMPQRQFMGHSKTLQNLQVAEIEKQVNKAFKL